MLVHDPCAAEKLTPPVPLVRVTLIQNKEPTLEAFGVYQSLVPDPFSVALPFPLRFSGVVPLQFGDCTLEPVSVMLPLPSWLTPPASLAIIYVPVTLNVPPDPPLIPMVSPPFVMLVHAPLAALKLVPPLPPVCVMLIQKPDPVLGVVGANQFEAAPPLSVAVPLPASIKFAAPL
jgi:hypothetical protein